MVDILEIPLEFFFGSEDFRYDTKSHPDTTAYELVQNRLKQYDQVISAVLGNELFIKLTAGKRAGTIGRIKNYKFDDFFRFNIWNSKNNNNNNNNCILGTEPKIVHVPDRWIGPGRSSSNIANGSARQAGRYYVDNVPCWQLDVRYGTKDINLEIDGRDDLPPFTLNSAFMDSARPVLLIGYSGPTIWSFAKQIQAKPTIKLSDRFGNEVGEGDLVILATRPSGLILVGKITKISPKRSVWLKHINASTIHMENNVRDDQLIQVKNIEQTLTLLKLSTL